MRLMLQDVNIENNDVKLILHKKQKEENFATAKTNLNRTLTRKKTSSFAICRNDSSDIEFDNGSQLVLHKSKTSHQK